MTQKLECPECQDYLQIVYAEKLKLDDVLYCPTHGLMKVNLKPLSFRITK